MASTASTTVTDGDDAAPGGAPPNTRRSERTRRMNKFFTIVGIIVVAWIALGLIGWLVGFLVKTVFWIAVVAGMVYIVATIVAKKQVGRR
jgi:hypothetical protein